MVQLNALTLLALASNAFAATISVSVGGSGDVFTPSSVKADVGDVVEFTFSGEHSVSQSKFSSPCDSSGDSMINSGIMGSGVFSVMINSTDPIYYFCAFARHCQQGMVGVINGPSSGDTLSAYESAAKSTSSSSAPQGVQHGILGDASAFGSSGSSSSAAASGTPVSSVGASESSAAASASAASSTLSTSASGTATGSGSTASSSNSAEKVKAFGVAGFAGLFAALLA